MLDDIDDLDDKSGCCCRVLRDGEDVFRGIYSLLIGAPTNLVELSGGCSLNSKNCLEK